MAGAWVAVESCSIWRHSTFRVFAFAASFAFTAPAQLKPTLKPADYGKWETLGPAALSPDGKWLAHEIRRTDKNDELRVGPAGGGKTQALAFCSNPAFSADSRWLACETTVSEAEQDKLKKAKKPVQNKMTVLELATGTVTTVDDVQSLAFSGDAAFLAFRRYPPTRDPGGARTRRRRRTERSGGLHAHRPQPRHRNRHHLRQCHRICVAGQRHQPGDHRREWKDAPETRSRCSTPRRVRCAFWIAARQCLRRWHGARNRTTWPPCAASSRMPTTAKATPCWRGRNLGETRTARVDAPRRIVASRPPQWSEDGADSLCGDRRVAEEAGRQEIPSRRSNLMVLYLLA